MTNVESGTFQGKSRTSVSKSRTSVKSKSGDFVNSRTSANLSGDLEANSVVVVSHEFTVLGTRYPVIKHLQIWFRILIFWFLVLIFDFWFLILGFTF